MTLRQVLAVNPDIHDLLLANDYLGFDTIGKCARAIIEHDDFGTRWEFNSLEDQKTVELWRTEVISMIHKPSCFINL